MSENNDSSNFVFKNMVEYFNPTEIQILAFKLKIDWDELQGEVKSEKVISLLKFVSDRDELPHLIDLLIKERPSIDWPSLRKLDYSGFDTIKTKRTTNIIVAKGGGSINIGGKIKQVGSLNEVVASDENSSVSAEELTQGDNLES